MNTYLLCLIAVSIALGAIDLIVNYYRHHAEIVREARKRNRRRYRWPREQHPSFFRDLKHWPTE